MRVFFFLLVLVNLLFFAWSRGYFSPGEPGALRTGTPLRADQIRLVSNDQPPEEPHTRDEAPPAAPDSADPATPTTPGTPPAESSRDVCIALNDVSLADAGSVERLLAENFPAFRFSRAAIPGNPSYWVRIPALGTRRAAEIKVGELRQLGVNEYFIMQEDSDSFAVSLGLFSTQAAAESALAALRGKGVRSARLIERPRRFALELTGPETRAGEVRQTLGQALPQVRMSTCARSGAQEQ